MSNRNCFRAGHGGLRLRWSGNGDFQGTSAVKLLKGSAFPDKGGTEWPGEPVHWQLHTGCGKKMGESYVYSRPTFEGGGNKKSGEIKPDG